MSTANPVVAGSRTALALSAAVLVTTDLAVKAVTEQALAGGRVIGLGLLQLRLSYNSGVAFSLGAARPAWLVIGVTGLITAVLAGYAWRAAPALTRGVRLALAAIVAGAVGNLVDRGTDGVVTDYLHTGWWPTFNLADVFITCGGGALALAMLRHDGPEERRWA